jgi:hypothetical protein
MGWVNAAVAIGGALIGSQASKSAAGKQSDAANRATDIEWDMYNQTRTDNLPFMQTGYSANDLINMLMGVAPTSGAATAGVTAPKLTDYNALRAQLLPQYTTKGDHIEGGFYQETVDEAALQKAIEAQMAKEQQAYQQFQSQQAAIKSGQATTGSENPLYGSLMKQYTPENMLSDPGYKWRMDQMQDQVQSSAAARGGLYSGATAKALQENAAGIAAQGYGDDWNRYETGKGNMLNALLGISGRGQTAVGNVSSAGQGYAGAAGNNLMNAANAQGAAGMNNAVIWGNTGNQLASMWGRRQPTAPSMASSSGGWGTGDMYGNQDQGMFYSDRRLKINIRPIGRTARGSTIYAWDWKTGGSGRGVIAQEVAHIPGAVHDDADGILMVDYSKV